VGRNFQSSQTDEDYQKHLARNRNRQGRNQDHVVKTHSQQCEEDSDNVETEEQEDGEEDDDDDDDEE
jgi:hypothetical protein